MINSQIVKVILLGLERRSIDRPYRSSLIRMTLSLSYALRVFAFAQICAKFDLLKVSALLIVLLSFLFHNSAVPQY